MRLKAWFLFIIGDLASRWPWDSRFVARLYTRAMRYPASVGFDHGVGPFKKDAKRLYPDRFKEPS